MQSILCPRAQHPLHLRPIRIVLLPATIQSPLTLTQRQKTRRPHTALPLQPNPLLELPFQHILGNSAADHRRHPGHPPRLKIHPPPPIATLCDGRRNRPQRQMRQLRPRRHANTRLRSKREPIFGKPAEYIPLTHRERLRRPHRRIEQPKPTRHAHDPRRLRLSTIERPRPSQPPTLFFPPLTPYPHCSPSSSNFTTPRNRPGRACSHSRDRRCGPPEPASPPAQNSIATLTS